MTIKECRKRIGFSKEKMASFMHITTDEYTKYEEKPECMPVYMAIIFSNIVGIRYDDIFLAATLFKIERGYKRQKIKK